MADPLILKVGGQQFEGWKGVDLRRGLDSLSGSFSVGLTDRWEGHPERWDIEAGSACSVYIGDDLVMTGWIDTAEYDEDAETHPIKFSGREKTADLIDCSAISTPGAWSGRKLEQIAGELTKPFGISAIAVADTGEAFPKFQLQQGETVAAALERMTRLRGLLMVTNAQGDLEFRRPGDKVAGYTLKEGENCLSIGFRNDVTERFSDYLVKGYAGGKDGPAARPKSAATDAGTPRYRPLLIVDSEQATAGSLLKRAQWEATVRAARTRSATVKVSGWRTEDGELFEPDRLVKVTGRDVGVDQELLVSEVQFSASEEQGQKTVLTLAPKEAFSLEPVPDSAPKKGGGAEPLTGE